MLAFVLRLPRKCLLVGGSLLVFVGGGGGAVFCCTEDATSIKTTHVEGLEPYRLT